jgi:short-subunit dehydrogenase
MHSRSQERADAAKKEIVEATKNENVHVHIVDMSRPGDIRKFVADFKSQQLPCHVLV